MAKYLIAILMAVSSIASYSQSQLVSSVALTVGQWLIKDHRHVYYVRVESTGKDFEDAKNKAFRTAIELAVGAIVVGESEVRNNRLIKNDTISYSSGVVNDFKVVSSNGNKIVMDVWVSRDTLADRIEGVIATSADGNIDTNKIEAAFRQAEKQKELDNANNRAIWAQIHSSTKLMMNILDDYPRAAFVAKLDKAKLVQNTATSAPHMEYTIDVEWNSKYVDSLTRAMIDSRNGSGKVDNNARYVQIHTSLLSWTNGEWAHDLSVADYWRKTMSRDPTVVIRFPSGIKACAKIFTTEFLVFPDNYGVQNLLRIMANRTVTRTIKVSPQPGQSPSDFANSVKGPFKINIVNDVGQYCEDL